MPGPDPSTNTSNAVQNRSMMKFEISHRLINRNLPISRIKLNRPSPLPRFHLLSRTFSREIRKLLGFGCPRNERSQGNTYMKSVSYIEGTRVTSLLDSCWKRIVAMARHRRLSVSSEIQAGRPTSVEYYFFSLSLSFFTTEFSDIHGCVVGCVSSGRGTTRLVFRLAIEPSNFRRENGVDVIGRELAD